ncbi:hypothetical protein HPP92_011773 [Vanilla planifolia]|uniref:Uncharacterized protein n=1 Tax=Vanilla planifolia TaxID=51239 RepID=A0A835R3J7_VANPL|nr:hypothetical protein HPP92_011773 [Vanilla planifolia]
MVACVGTGKRCLVSSGSRHWSKMRSMPVNIDVYRGSDISGELNRSIVVIGGASIGSCVKEVVHGNCKMSKVKNMIFPLDVMEFCNENLLACGSDDEHGGSATVQLWDIESPQSFINFPANTSVLVMEQLACLIFARVMQLIICLLEQITRLHLFHLATVVHTFVPLALNSTLVWDTRLMPTNVQQMHLGKASEVRDMDLVRPLHCLSHGKQMPTAEHIGQLPGHVDEGDQGAMMLNGFKRASINNCQWGWEVAVAPNDEYLHWWR